MPCAAKSEVQPVEAKGRERRCKIAKYAMIGKAEPIPQNSRSTVCDAFDCLQDDLVTSQIVLIECATHMNLERRLLVYQSLGHREQSGGLLNLSCSTHRSIAH